VGISAFAVVSIITYALLYSRPRDVQTVREVDATRYPTPVELTQIMAAGAKFGLGNRHGVTISNNGIHRTTSGWTLSYSITVVLVVFGGLHLLAWNYEFPTQVERRL
jgi:hypothetical protein